MRQIKLHDPGDLTNDLKKDIKMDHRPYVLVFPRHISSITGTYGLYGGWGGVGEQILFATENIDVICIISHSQADCRGDLGLKCTK